jgi:N-acetylglucosaminyl-diphospho-decaprenol L-rhamnosyltransferase
LARSSAIIVSFRTGPVLSDCLDALSKAEQLDEIIIVDNGNPAREAKTLDDFIASRPSSRLLRGHGNIGFAAACNLGARRAKGTVLFFINPDVILAPDAVARLLALIEGAPSPTILGGDLRDPQGNPERGSRRDRLTLWRAFVAFAGLSRFERVLPIMRDFNRHRDPLPTAPVSVGAVSGALMVMRRADFETLGGFDEGYFLHVEDIDICRRAEIAGWRVLFAPGRHGVHVRSSSKVASRFVAGHKARSLARYFRKFAAGPFEVITAAAASAALHLLARGNGSP